MFITSTPSGPVVAAPSAVLGGETGDLPEVARPLLVGRDITPAEAARLSSEGLVAGCVADVVVCTDGLLDLHVRAECLGLLLRHDGVNPSEWAVGHEAAAWVYRGALTAARAATRSLTADTADTLDRVVLLGPRGRSSRYTSVLVHRQAALEEDEVVTLPGLRLTSPARTAADLLRLLPPAAARAQLTRLQAATAVTAVAIDEILRRRRGVRGAAGARRVLHEWASTEGPRR